MAARSNFATSSRGTARSSCTHSSHGRLSTLPMLHASTRQGISQIKCTKVRIKENAQNEHCARPIEVVNRSSPLVFAAPIIRVHLRPLADLRCMAATFASCTDHAVIDLGRILAACLFVVKLTLAARRHGVPSLVCVLRAHLSEPLPGQPFPRCHPCGVDCRDTRPAPSRQPVAACGCHPSLQAHISISLGGMDY